MSIECAIVCLVVVGNGVYIAYQLGRLQVLAEWKMWLEELNKKLEEEVSHE